MTVRLLALLAFVASACTRSFPAPPPEPPTRPECTFNSDCTGLQVCADGHCRAQCREDRDCTAGALCRPGTEAGSRVCLPPSAEALCTFQSDCPTGQACLPDRHCHAQCHANEDCASGGLCSDGTCSSASSVVTDGGCVTCGARCVELSADPNHCGGCDHACAQGEGCVAGVCTGDRCGGVRCNDTCDGAFALNFSANRASIHFAPDAYTNGSQSCTGDPDAYYSYQLGSRAFVSADVILNGSRGGIALLDGCGDEAVRCSIGCFGGFESTFLVQDAGSYVLLVSAGTASDVNLGFYPLPDDLPVDTLGNPASFTVTASATPASGPPVCGMQQPVHAWLAGPTCSPSQSPLLTLTTCGSPPGTSLALVDPLAGGVTVCGTPDPACDGGMALSWSPSFGESPVFFMVTTDGSADGGTLQVTGSWP